MVYGLIQLALLGGAMVLPLPASVAISLPALAVAAGTLVFCVVRLRPVPLLGWWLMAVSLLALLASGATDVLRGPGGTLSPLSLSLRAASLPLLAAGLAIVGRRYDTDSELADVVDAAMAAAGALLVVWLFVTDPITASGTRLEAAAAAALSLGSVLVFMAGAKLVFSCGLRGPTWVLLAVAAAFRVTAVLSLLLPAVHLTSLTTNRLNSLFLATHAVLLGAAGLCLPFVQNRRSALRGGTDLSPGRVVLFMALAVVVPSVLAFELVNRSALLQVTLASIGVPTGAAATLLLLLVARLTLIARLSQRRALELTHRSAALADAVTEQKALQHQLAHLAMHDALTGLPNRVVLAERLEWTLRSAGGSDSQAVLLIDLDGFKDINDTFGHPTGDEILVAVSRRLLTAAPAGAVVARIGGDEFAILVETVPGQPQALAQAERIIEAIRRPFVVDEQHLFLSTSIGLLTIGSDQRPVSPTDVLRDADFALYAAKKAGKNRAVPFDPRLRAYRLERVRTISGLHYALDHNDLFLHYQPIIDLATRGMVGVEALVRWRLPGGETVPPAQFIPVAEETGLINAVGARVLRQACRDAHRWHPARGVFVAVNVSGRQLDDPGFADMVSATLVDCGLSPAGLVLELTESSLIGTMPDQQGSIQLKRLREYGIRIAIDDFGTGYSSLSYLSRLPMDIVKLDKSFTPNRSDPATSRPGWAFTGAILDAIASLDLKVIAEGVETPEQAKALRNLSCPYAQGYLFSRPVPAEDIDQTLQVSARNWDQQPL